MIIVKIASIPDRMKQLEYTIHRMLNNVDQFDVYLNNYPTIPSFLRNPKIQVFTSQVHGDRGDIGKFFQIDHASGYIFTIDDDVIYPNNYIQSMVKKIDFYKKKAFICVHANLLPKHKLSSYYKEKIGIHFQSELKKDKRVDVPGTGTLGFHTDEIKLKIDIFAKPNMTDIWLAIHAKNEGIPIICIKRTAGWLSQARGKEFNKSIYTLSFNSDSYQTQLINQAFYFNSLYRLTNLFFYEEGI